MEDSLHLKTEPILIFVNDFLNVMARFGITSDEELFLLLCYYSQTQMDGTGLFIKWWTDDGAKGLYTLAAAYRLWLRHICPRVCLPRTLLPAPLRP